MPMCMCVTVRCTIKKKKKSLLKLYYMSTVQCSYRGVRIGLH